jgi:hypothetical protein
MSTPGEGQSADSHGDRERFRDEKRRSELRKTAGTSSEKSESAENPTQKEQKKSESESRDKS